MSLAELLPSVQQLTESEKLELVRILSADLLGGRDISPLEPFKTYILSTPYSSFGAGAQLMQAKQENK